MLLWCALRPRLASDGMHVARQLSASTPLAHRRFASSETRKPLRCLIMGCPGSGKGTQTKYTTRTFPIVALSSGDLLRRHIFENTSIGQIAANIIKTGGLVGDDVINELMFEEIDRLKDQNWMLDGFPRTISQAQLLDAHLQATGQPLDVVINLDVPEEVILQRVIDRWVHGPSGRTYNLSYNPPKREGLDDVTGEPLTKRPDDNIETFKIRLEKYHELTQPLIEYYQRQGTLKTFFGRTSDEIQPHVEKLLLEMGLSKKLA
ncbi:adenylate kinase [Polychytrium aggregatum]|uniref:adenylate kinase n=1 Tax=Polychytrium aggregatum TaxID=110093 RepID=UPI0022FE48AB|nr:adenylate kinase [Polychytrium aggregatum]KAI9190776.1 adenylate kinase [Polychytrium aggregatum]